MEAKFEGNVRLPAVTNFLLPVEKSTFEALRNLTLRAIIAFLALFFSYAPLDLFPVRWKVIVD